jgi:hypothetical protein
MARRCPVRETVFTVATATSRQVFCSPTCRETNRNSKPALQICPVCENEFTTTVARRRSYCSEECRSTARTSEDVKEKRTCPGLQRSVRNPEGHPPDPLFSDLPQTCRTLT